MRPQAAEVEDAVRNHLHHNVTLLARLKPQDILRMRDDMKGTKKKMAVYRCAGHSRAGAAAARAVRSCRRAISGQQGRDL